MTKTDVQEKSSSKYYDELIAFLQQKGFIWGPEPEIYGGLAGFYTYAPLGKLLKNNVENEIRKLYTKNGFWEVECPTIMQKEVWQASGHLGGFTDPVITCSKCKANFRVDSLLAEAFPEENFDHKTDEEFIGLIESKGIKCPSCKSAFNKEIKRHTLMMKTTVGLDVEAYNRPETATTTYLPFLRYTDFFRKKLPFAVFQIGKVYRNEISPRQHVMRCREFTQAEAQLFLFKNQKNNFEKYVDVQHNKMLLWPWQFQEKEQGPKMITVHEALENGYFKNKAYAWAVHLAYSLFQSIGIPQEKIRLRQHYPDEKAFYAEDAWDIEVQLNTFGWFEICGVHDRTDYDLTQHGKFSGKSLSAFNEEATVENKNEIPHIIEIAFGTDRPTFALLDIFYKKFDEQEGKTKFLVPAHMAPVKVAVFPLMKKDGLAENALQLFETLQQEFSARYDSAGSIGKRYLREDESGTPYCITVDYDTIKPESPHHGTVTIRNRDTEEQKRIKLIDVKETIKKLLSYELKWENIS
ncbi:MAG: glycine--tRNA ligase [Candidatus Woesearchaeota archaeon]